MAQQMEFDELSSVGQRPAFHPYDTGYHDPFDDASGQKASSQQVEQAPLARQRLTPIVSLGVLLLLSLGAMSFFTNGGRVITLATCSAERLIP
jgi:hypothetical protein